MGIETKKDDQNTFAHQDLPRLVREGKIRPENLFGLFPVFFQAAKMKRLDPAAFREINDAAGKRIDELKAALETEEDEEKKKALREGWREEWRKGSVSHVLLVFSIKCKPSTTISDAAFLFTNTLREVEEAQRSARKMQIAAIVEARGKLFRLLAEDAPEQACRERDCPAHDWSGWAVNTALSEVDETKIKMKGNRDRHYVFFGACVFRLSRRATRFCRICGKAQATLLRDPDAIAQAEKLIGTLMAKEAPFGFPENFEECKKHRDFLSSWARETKDLEKGRAAWADGLGDFHVSGQEIRLQTSWEELEPLVRRSGRADMREAWDNLLNVLNPKEKA